MRNSGTTDAIVRRQAALWCRCILGPGQLKKNDPNDDPLFRLQTLARLGIQYDLADRLAIVVTPSIISFFVLRDGWYAHARKFPARYYA